MTIAPANITLSGVKGNHCLLYERKDINHYNTAFTALRGFTMFTENLTYMGEMKVN